MYRFRIVAESVSGRYTIAVVRQITDKAALELARNSRGKARSIIPTDVAEIVAYRETYDVDGMATGKTELGRIPA
jgi:hypothetical protein